MTDGAAGRLDAMARSGEKADDSADAGTAPGAAVGTDMPGTAASSCRGVLADDLGWALGVTFRAYVAATHSVLADLPGGPRGYQVLSAAASGAVNSQLALAQHLGIDRTVMTYLLDDLEGAGLIERHADPADRRARRIVATARGRGLLATLNERLEAAEAQLLAPLDPAEQASFRTQLRLLATRADAADPVASPCTLVDELDAAASGPLSPF